MDEPLSILLEDYLNYLLTIKGLSKTTIEEYQYDLSAFFRFLVRRRKPELRNRRDEEIDFSLLSLEDLQHVSLRELEAYLAYSKDGKLPSANRRARKTSTLRGFFKYLVLIEELLEKNPVDKLTSPKKKKRQPVYFTLEEAVHLIQTAGQEENRFFRLRDVAIIVTFLTTGIRLSELVGLNVSDLKEDHFTVLGKGNKERTVYITPACAHALEAYLSVRPRSADEPALFLSSRKKRLSQRAVQHRMDLLLCQAGFDRMRYSVHKLRHTAATLMYKEGVDIRTLQKILGHASIATTQIYTHVEDPEVKKGLEANPLAHISLQNSPDKK